MHDVFQTAKSSVRFLLNNNSFRNVRNLHFDKEIMKTLTLKSNKSKK